MAEKPILFSAPMVRAIMAGTKTQTRRIVKPQPEAQNTVYPPPPDGEWLWRHKKLDAGYCHTNGDAMLRLMRPLCPYGVRGDRLWVRETWAPLTKGYAYRADPIWNAPPADRWHPSIHMPRVASRITLEITGVRVERLQDISEADARAEGSPCVDEASGREVLFPDESRCGTFKLGYRCLWESINGRGSWDANPFVWVVHFHRVG
jgi:hypothetical protein